MVSTAKILAIEILWWLVDSDASVQRALFDMARWVARLKKMLVGRPPSACSSRLCARARAWSVRHMTHWCARDVCVC